MTDRKDPFRGFNFRLEMSGVTEAGFRECSGLDASTDVAEYREGKDQGNLGREAGVRLPRSPGHDEREEGDRHPGNPHDHGAARLQRHATEQRGQPEAAEAGPPSRTLCIARPFPLEPDHQTHRERDQQSPFRSVLESHEPGELPR